MAQITTTVGTITVEPKSGGPGGGPADFTGGPGFAPPRRDGGGGDWQQPQKLPLGVYRVAMLTGLAAILMMFAGLISVFIVRGMNVGWKPIALPKTLWLSTLLLLGSSFALVKARRALSVEDHAGYRKFLLLTTGLGVAFVWAQLASWATLAARGVYLSGSPHSSFFYMFTGLHGVHVAGGLTALAWLWQNARKGAPQSEFALEKRQALAGAASLYWHFMDGLWACLFALLLLWK